VKGVLAGLGAVEALAGGGARVVASFPKALYVEAAAGIAALVAPGVGAGPLHVLLASPPMRTVAGATVRIDLSGAGVWRGSLPEPDAIAGTLPAILEALAPVAAGNLVPTARGRTAVGCLRDGDLTGAAAALGGAGPGLTPAGDDALAGVLFALGALRHRPEADLVAAARSVATTGISSAFLVWAARGQALAPVHGLLAAAVTGDAAAARHAAGALAGVGKSSGADFALGLTWGLTWA